MINNVSRKGGTKMEAELELLRTLAEAEKAIKGWSYERKEK